MISFPSLICAHLFRSVGVLALAGCTASSYGGPRTSVLERPRSPHLYRDVLLAKYGCDPTTAAAEWNARKYTVVPRGAPLCTAIARMGNAVHSDESTDQYGTTVHLQWYLPQGQLLTLAAMRLTDARMAQTMKLGVGVWLVDIARVSATAR